MPFQDLRQFINKVGEVDRCLTINDADWDLEIGGITELAATAPDGPMLLFDNIKGYQPEYRVATNVVSSLRRTALALDLPLDARPLQAMRLWQERMKQFKSPTSGSNLSKA